MSYTIKNLSTVEDSAAKFGFSEIGEAHFARGALDAERTGLAYHVLKPGKRQAFGHRHDDAEEINVVISGGGRVKLDDEIVELRALDAIRVAPHVTRQFEAGPEGMTYVVFGPHHEGDVEMLNGWWQD
jgi:mannose-6-phosphate isomerase-like protein (cupin superfamily)